MKREDYIAIAAAIKGARERADRHYAGNPHADTVSSFIIHDVAAALSKDNPQFDFAKFATACMKEAV